MPNEILPLDGAPAIAAPHPRVGLQLTADPTTGYAAIQNAIPVLRSLVVTNLGQAPVSGLTVTIACSPRFAAGVSLPFDILAPGESRKVGPLDLQADHGYLSRLDETELAVIEAVARADGAIVGQAGREIAVLAYDQWPGTRALPELLAAFCMPNSPVVDHVIAGASALLRAGDGAGAMNGYQSKNREQVWKQISAIYSSLLAEELHYANPPASFGTDGQKIRTPERILATRLATCLDTAMLFASCFEQAGLHPVLLFKDGHAWVGVWLVETCFATAVVDDIQSVRKRVKSGELLAFETTGVAGGARPTLRAACLAADAYLAEHAQFLYAVDIRRARELQIRPLPSRAGADRAAPPEVAATAAPALEPMPALPTLDLARLPAVETAPADTPEARLSQWKSKLLDLTLRNRLLNFKPSKTNLRLICPDPCALEDSLAEGRDFKIRAAPATVGGADQRDPEVFAARHAATPRDAMAADALARGEIMVDVDQDKLDLRLLEIFRAAGTSLEEGGANTLFLTFGLLEWQEEKDAEARHLAPILLIPVTLTRQSVRSGFRLTRHDDDALVNPTLIQKLGQDFSLKLPSFEVLPTDEKGIDVDKILQVFRLQVAELKGWEVQDQVHLGIFSFAKYLMWKDLQERRQQLLASPVVAHLINHPGKAFADSETGFDPATLDEQYRPQDLFAPMLSDSSQLRAICLAGEGKNLVVVGPPGTGKSQTITNLIAHLLATGKSVLFVSEKMAALEVVHRRLNAIGLAAFCFELHSSKAKKVDVLKQLGAALDAAGQRSVKDWDREADRLALLRRDLNGLSRALHRVHSNDLTIYDAIGLCVERGDESPAPMPWQDVNQHGRDELETLRETSRQMAALAGQLSGLSGHPLAAIAKPEWTPSWQQALLDAADALSGAAGAAEEGAAPLLELFGMPGHALSLAELAELDRLADVLMRAPSVPPGVAKAAHDESAHARLAALHRHGVARLSAWDGLQGAYRDEFKTVRASELSMAWRAASATWWPRNWFGKRAVLNRLRLFRQDGQRPPAAQLPQLCATLAQVNAEDAAIDAMAGESRVLLQDAFAGDQTDWNMVAASAEWARSFADTLLRFAGGDPARHAMLKDRLEPFVSSNRAMLKPGAPLAVMLLAYREAHRAFVAALGEASAAAACQDALGLAPAVADALPRLRALTQGWRQSARQIQPWCLWQKVRAKALAQGLQGLVACVERGQVALSGIAPFFEFSYQSWWLKKAIDGEPALCAFSSADHERKIAEFRAADARFQKLSEHYIAAKLAAQIPSSAGIVPGADSEMGKLRRELQKQRKHMPIRQLMHSLPTLLPKLKPCMLMSPLSVAQYLDPSHAQFDVVIFDEASQIPVWDAVGAIARGRQLVCVGDPKQLPPTNFFNRLDDSDDVADEDNVQDLESILDECLSIGMPKLSLNWHYRSRHESLITFSNVTYYDNALVTFPSPVTEDKAVRFERVAGVYDRGGTRTNRAEADAIVAAIEAHFLAPDCRQTLGVVTFNQAQQNLIERLLDARRHQSLVLDQAIARVADEPLFIKNIENVQGDERDVIYFSITYGPDAAGKVNMNFGPLNLDGGHRRLNVAVSRARQGVTIFSTLMPEQIDLSKVRAAGVRDLKNYLEFALRGAGAIAPHSSPSGAAADSPFEREVMAVLRAKGWTVHPQVGAAGYRIDLGVVDPRVPGRYLLGVECDGRTYHSGATARDRDRLRQHVLEGLGWQLTRVWSADWWRDPEEPIRKLEARLAQLLASAPEVEDEAEAAPPAAPSIATAAESSTELAAPVNAPLEVYQSVALEQQAGADFYSPASVPLLTEQLRTVIDREGPIADAQLFKKVARAWGLARMGRRIEDVLAGLVPGDARVSGADPRFYWPAARSPGEWPGFRVAGESEESRRAIDEICDEEIVNLALFILGRHGQTTSADLARSACRLLKIARTTAESEQRIMRALGGAHASGKISIADQLVSLVAPA